MISVLRFDLVEDVNLTQPRLLFRTNNIVRCPGCSFQDDRVLETRVQKDGAAIRRRRECLHCKTRFTTLESLLIDGPMVIKKDGRREPFQAKKVASGIQAACQKRPIPLAVIEQTVDRITRAVQERPEKELSSVWIGHLVMGELKKLDDVAYVRFASVYREFKDVQEFVAGLGTEEATL